MQQSVPGLLLLNCLKSWYPINELKTFRSRRSSVSNKYTHSCEMLKVLTIYLFVTRLFVIKISRVLLTISWILLVKNVIGHVHSQSSTHFILFCFELDVSTILLSEFVLFRNLECKYWRVMVFNSPIQKKKRELKQWMASYVYFK